LKAEVTNVVAAIAIAVHFLGKQAQPGHAVVKKMPFFYGDGS
jgi:hypothetical protein